MKTFSAAKKNLPPLPNLESNQQTESDPEVQQPSQKNDVERPNKSTKVILIITKCSFIV